MNTRKSSKYKTNFETPVKNNENKQLSNSDRVLRPRHSLYSKQYQYMNTNTNNPDDGERPWMEDRNNLSDDDFIEDTEEADNTESVDSNNANTKKIPNYLDKLTTNWYQKNMFGLSDEDSDRNLVYGSGTISGDEQCEIEPFSDNSTNNNQFSKRHMNKTSNSSSNFIQKKSNTNSHRNSFSDLSCSPTAIIYSIITSIFIFMQFIYYSTARFMRKLTNFQAIKNTFHFILTLPVRLTSSLLEFFSTSISNMKTKSRRSTSRKASQSNSNKNGISFFNYVAKFIWLLFWIIIGFMILRWLFVNVDRNSVSRVGSGVTSLSQAGLKKFINLADDECMRPVLSIPDPDTAVLQFILARRALFCVFSYPSRLIINSTIPGLYTIFNTFNSYSQESTSSSNIDQTVTKQHTSDVNPRSEQLQKLEETLANIQMRLISQEVTLKQFKDDSNNRLKNVENSQSLIQSYKRIIEALQKDLKDVVSDVKLVKGLSDESRNLGKSLKSLKTDFENQLNTMKLQILKLENSIDKYGKSGSRTTSEIEKLRKDLVGLTGNLEKEMKFTKLLDEKQNNYLEHSKNIKQEIQEELDLKLQLIRKENGKIRQLFDLKLSNIEGQIHEMLQNSTVNNNLRDSRDDIATKLMDKDLDEKIKLSLDSFAVNSSHFNTIINEKIKQTIYDQDNLQLPCSASTCRCLKSCLPSDILPGSSQTAQTEVKQCMRLNDVRQTIDDALRTFAADRIGLADFALESAGGTIASTRCTETYTDRAAILTILGLPLFKLTNSPRTIIQPSLNPGECWAMKGSQGSVVIQLSQLVNVSSVTIDHIPKSLSPSGTIESAIKNFEIRALDDEKDTVGHSLGNFTYNIESNPIQTFQTKSKETNFIELIVRSNYGHKEYTCIYRVRVHGDLINH